MTSIFLIFLGIIIIIAGFIAVFIGEKEDNKLKEKIDTIKNKWNR